MPFYTCSQQNGPVRVNPITPFMWFELVFTKLFWAAWRIVLPLMHPAFHTSLGSFCALFMISEFVTGYFLAFNFQVLPPSPISPLPPPQPAHLTSPFPTQVSHVSTECDYPLGESAKDQIPDEWAVSQVKSSVDYSHGNALMTFFCGALNYQVTHHLFPTISQVRRPSCLVCFLVITIECICLVNRLPVM